MTIAHRTLGLVVLAWVLNANGIANGILHCVTAKQMCLKDPTCAVLLDIVAESCGETYDEMVCSSPDLVNCRDALYKVWKSRIFQGDCICGDNAEDPECYQFRNSIFNHPCLKIPQRDPPQSSDGTGDFASCYFAYSLCKNDYKCKAIYDNFRKMCKVKDGVCAMPNWVSCSHAWDRFQMTPVYGCLCHEEKERDKCTKTYHLIYNNPCLEALKNWVTPYWVPQESSTQTDTSVEWITISSDDSVGGHTTLTNIDSGEDVDSPTVTTTDGAIPEVATVKFHTSLFKNGVVMPQDYPGTNDLPPVVNRHPIKFPTSAIEARNTCERAHEMCNKDKTCQILLGNMAQACEPESGLCNRTECMGTVLNFYTINDMTIKGAAAFCICRYDDESCLGFQRKLHPVCSQRSDNGRLQCHVAAQTCQSNSQCRPRLKRFVESCAVDQKTIKCRGPLDECRMAVIEILGTQLHSNCVCIGNDVTMLYQCLDWQRLVWVNPCIVQAQKDYLESMLMPPSTSPMVTVKPPKKQTPVLEPPQTSTLSTEVPRDPGEESTFITNFMTSTDVTKGCFIDSKDTNTRIQIPINLPQRIYDKANKQCSMVCTCPEEGNYSCVHIGCVFAGTCHTEVAVYHHSSPAFIAEQGHCRCFSGKFICTRPPENVYQLNPGVYLFLGYSKEDEDKVKKNTNVTIADAVRYLQKMANTFWYSSQGEDGSIPKSSTCKLTQGEQYEENVILQAYLEEYTVQRENNSITEEIVNREYDICSPVLQNISTLIMTKQPPVTNHVALSIIKVAGVEKRVKGSTGSGGKVEPCRCLVLWAFVLVLLAFGVQGAQPLGPPP